MRTILTSVLFGAFVILAGKVNAQVPAPLDSSKFPKPFDSVFIKASRIPATETFTDTTAANDSLTIDRCLQKAIQALNDTYMEDIQYGGPNKTWTVVTFYYTNLPNPNNWKKIWLAPNPFVPGASYFPNANLYYQSMVSGGSGLVASYNFFEKNSTGFYELGSRVMETTPMTSINTPPKPVVYFPVDYNNPNNVTNEFIQTVMSTATTNTHLNVTVDAYGTLTLVTGTIGNPVYTNYPNCLRTVTYSIDTISISGIFNIYLKTKIYSWYTPDLFEPIVIYSVAQIRSNVDPAFWQAYPAVAWHDEIEMSFCVPYTNAGVESVEQSGPLSLIPNPTQGPVTLLLSDEGLKKIEVFDILGKPVISSSTYDDHFNFDMSSYNKGIYLVRLTAADGKTTTKKLIVK